MLQSKCIKQRFAVIPELMRGDSIYRELDTYFYDSLEKALAAYATYTVSVVEVGEDVVKKCTHLCLTLELQLSDISGNFAEESYALTHKIVSI